MTTYRVEFTTAAAKELRKLDAQIRRRVLSGIAELEREPRPHGVRNLSGYDNAWRVRIGDYRVLYEVIDDQVLVTVVRVAHHETYTRSERRARGGIDLMRHPLSIRRRHLGDHAPRGVAGAGQSKTASG